MNKTYDVIHIQKHVNIKFDIVIPDTIDLIKKHEKSIIKIPSHVGIRANRIYKKYETILVQDILNLYTPNDNLMIVDYNTDYYFALMCSVQNFKVIYINQSQRYNKFLKMSQILNNITFQNLNSRFKINKAIGTPFVPLLIVNDIADIMNSKRILRNHLHNVLIIRDEIEDNLYIYRQLLHKSFKLYKVKKHLEIINNIKIFLDEDNTTSIIAIAPGSKLQQHTLLHFD